MALKHHSDHYLRFTQQVENSRNYVLPFIEEAYPVAEGYNILEIGCGEGGVLQPFLERGCKCTGVDLDKVRLVLGAEFLEKYVADGSLEFSNQNIYEESFLSKYQGHFNVILLKDVIEHVPEQEKFIPYLRKLLKPGGKIFFGFPPWYMPHGGHQQLVKNKYLGMMPYIHLLPNPLYRGLLKSFGETPGRIEELMEIKDTGISIERFEKIVKQNNFTIANKRFYLINPIYKYKFNLKPRVQTPIISNFYFVRNFLTTCVYYLIG